MSRIVAGGRPMPTPERHATSSRRAIDMCVWPECDAEPWREAEVPLCSRHAVTVYVRVGDMVPGKPC